MTPIHVMLRERRKALGWSQRDLRDRLGLRAQSQISELETGRSQPTLRTLVHWANALGYDVRLVDREPS